MTAPAPSPYEQAVIERFGIFDEERVVEEVARAIAAHRVNGGAPQGTICRCGETTLDHDLHVAAAAVAAYRATQVGGAEEAVRRTPADYVAEARQRMLDEGEDPDQPVYACGNPS